MVKQATKQKTIEDLLLDKRLLSKEDYKRIKDEASRAGGNPVDIIREEKIVDEEKLASAQGELLRVPYIDLHDRRIPSEILNRIPEAAARNYRMVAFEEEKGELKIAMEDPQNLDVQEALEFIAKGKRFSTSIFITSPLSIDYALKYYERALGLEVSEALKEVGRKLEEEEKKEEVLTEGEIEKIAKMAPISKTVAIILKHAVERRASDIHIEPSEDKLRVRYRIDGILTTSLILSKKVHPAVISRIKILANLKIDEHRVPQDGRFRLTISKQKVDFRVSILPTIYGEKVAMRILDTSQELFEPETLGITGRNLRIFRQAVKKPYGMFLVSGPTGSGKTTTLYSVLKILNKEAVNIVTLEDPVEYSLEGMSQVQVNPRVGLSFASGLRSIVRQDPDIIMVGEIRDNETAEMAIHAALTGHIVLSTLHTNSAAGAVPRLIDMKVEPFLLISTLNIVVAQRLVRKICEDCKEKIKVSSEIEKEIRKEIESLPVNIKSSLNLGKKITLYRGRGCKKCANKGYKGRIGIYEFMPINSASMQRLIAGKAGSMEIAAQAKNEGMITMRQDGMIKILQGLTTLEEVVRVTKEV